MTVASPSPSLIREELEQMLTAREFCRARFLRRFLRRTIEESLRGNHDQIKELWLGTAVFERKAEFDPARDPIVRVQVRRLRQKLEHYYAGEGLNRQIRISYPRGSYIPVFTYAYPLNAFSVRTMLDLESSQHNGNFYDRFSEELTRALAGLPSLTLRVATGPPGASGQSTADHAQIAKLTVEIVDRGSGVHLWTGSFELDINSPDATDLARRVAVFLKDGEFHPGSLSYSTSAKPRFM